MRSTHIIATSTSLILRVPPLLALLFASSAWAEAVVPVPATKDQLEGTRLLIPEASCSIDIPGPDWKWMTAQSGKTRNYLCMNRTSTIILLSIGSLTMELTDHQPKSLIESAKKKGGKILNDKIDFVESPAARKAARVSFEEADAAGKKSFIAVYLVNTVDQVLLHMQCKAPAAADLDAIKKVFESLKPLKKPASAAEKK
ncbi:MAG TPA: hypothetical protein VGP72_16045 [Planctomycetota bacterium]|jgi:hypothetical protein